jgi:hypothetical protein
VPDASPASRAASGLATPRTAAPGRGFPDDLALQVRSGAPAAARAAKGQAKPAAALPVRRALARPAGAEPEASAALPAGDAPGPPGAAAAPAISAPVELAAAIRSLAPAAVALSARGGGELSLAFGDSLSVNLRSGAQGLELVLRPAPALMQAAQAGLPGLVEALRARGVRVARTEVRPRPGRQRGGPR